MTQAERAEVIMRKHLGAVPPWDRPWKRRAFELILESLPEIAAYEELGFDMIADHGRRQTIALYLGDPNNERRDHYNFNVWLLNKCMGDSAVGGDDIFWRCKGCFKLRTAASIAKGQCKCGSMSLSNCVNDVNTRKAIAHLAMGY